jgi:predicted RNA binding protein YcfA (HicA-like mRNA interferase family)
VGIEAQERFVQRGLMEKNSRKLMQMLKKDGWVLDRVSGDHHTFKHPGRVELITLPHPKKDLPTGLVRSIYRLASWK